MEKIAVCGCNADDVEMVMVSCDAADVEGNSADGSVVQEDVKH